MFKFGRKPYTPDERVKHYSALLNGYSPPPVPDNIDWLSAMPEDVGMLGNDRHGNCFWAGAYHQASLWLKHTSGLDVVESEENVLKAYSEACGFVATDPDTDVGTEITEGLTYLMNTGLPVGTLGGRRKIDGFFLCSRDHVLPVMWECGGIGLGINVYRNNQPEGEEPADVFDYIPGQPLIGKHWVIAAKYDKKEKLYHIETWGSSRRWALTENFMDNAVEVAYGIASTEWVNGNTGRTPLGMTQLDWKRNMAELRS